MERTQVILITGASSGFGKVTAQALAGKGYVVYGTSRRIANGNIGQVRMLIADVTDENSVRSAVNRIMEEQGHIDVLINNAGMGIGGALEMATDEEISSQMDTNFMGMVRMCRAVLPIMRKQRQGKIINISSIAGRIAVPYQVYPFGIKVCVVEPGDFNTGFTASRNISPATLACPDYGKRFKRTLKIIEEAETNGCPPSKLAAAICKLIEKKNPPFRTLTGPWTQVAFARFKGWIPGKVIRYALRSFYEIK